MFNTIKAKFYSLLFLFSFVFFSSLGYNFYNENNLRKDLNNFANAVSISVAEQNKATVEISQNVANASNGAQKMAKQINSLNNSIDEFLSRISVS